ncbi:MAG: PAC2 family protein [Nitrososphaerales archaeon]
MTVTMEIREYGEIQLRGGVLIDCTDGHTYENSRVGRYLIEQLNMEHIAVIESEVFPAISTIINHQPNFPMRVYANQSTKIACLVSDFIPIQAAEKPLGKALVNWAKSKSIALIITSFQVSAHQIEVDTAGACSTNNARLRLEQSRIDRLESLRITGLPAALLNEGNWTNVDVISLVLQSVPSGRSVPSITERIVQGIDVLLPEIKFNFKGFNYGIHNRFPLELDPRSPSSSPSSNTTSK